MTLLRRLFTRPRSRTALASTPLAAPSGAAPTGQWHYLTEVPYLLPTDPLEDQRLTYGRD